MASRGQTPGSRARQSPRKQRSNVNENEGNETKGQNLNDRDVEMDHLKTTLIAMNQKIEIISDIREDAENHRQHWLHAEGERDKLNTHIQQTSIKIQQNTSENKAFQDQLIQENGKLKDEIERLHKTINEMDSKNKKQTSTILEQNSIIIELREILKKKESVEDQLRVAREQNQNLENQKGKMQKELEIASDYILELEDKVYKANKTSLELLRQLKDAEVEIETLKNYIIELKQRIAVYIPAKDDSIDKKLAEFINNYPERSKLKIMFMRESEGVYQFGTKRVAVRVDKDKINIRVGGGYLSIDEFLDQYTPAELEKLERKDPLKKFSEKVAIQKTIIGKELREQSPVRSPTRDRSPAKN